MSRVGRPPKCGGCGECDRCKRAAYMRDWYARLTPDQRREKVAARDRAKTRANDARRYQRHRTKRDALSLAWAKRNPEKRHAHAVVKRALAAGTLTRQPCEVCGAEKAHAHHDDYSKPLIVRWLCPAHHAEVHAAT
jgi:hypothetical protein